MNLLPAQGDQLKIASFVGGDGRVAEAEEIWSCVSYKGSFSTIFWCSCLNKLGY